MARWFYTRKEYEEMRAQRNTAHTIGYNEGYQRGVKDTEKRQKERETNFQTWIADHQKELNYQRDDLDLQRKNFEEQKATYVLGELRKLKGGV